MKENWGHQVMLDSDVAFLVDARDNSAHERILNKNNLTSRDFIRHVPLTVERGTRFDRDYETFTLICWTIYGNENDRRLLIR